MNKDLNSSVLTDKDAAQYIGMSVSWMRIARIQGNPEAPPFVKIGRSIRYLREDLDQWLKNKRCISTLGHPA